MTVPTTRTTRNTTTMNDPSAAHALEDDADEWIPLAPPSVVVDESSFQEVLQAVDDLLLYNNTNDTASSTASDENDDNDNGAADSTKNRAIVLEKDEHSPYTRESPLKLRRRIRAARRVSSSKPCCAKSKLSSI